MRIYIHAGHLSLDNGAYAPLTTYFNLAKAIGVEADSGSHYGDDALEIDDKDWPVVESMLVESKMLYKVDGVHSAWQNVHTDRVRQVLRMPVTQ
jgi:hypothetical protein